MQISIQEVQNAQKAARQDEAQDRSAPVETVDELARESGVRMDEVRRFAALAESAEDLVRERRLRDIARRVAEGTYRVESEDLLEMAERRAIADRSTRP